MKFLIALAFVAVAAARPDGLISEVSVSTELAPAIELAEEIVKVAAPIETVLVVDNVPEIGKRETVRVVDSPIAVDAPVETVRVVDSPIAVDAPVETVRVVDSPIAVEAPVEAPAAVKLASVEFVQVVDGSIHNAPVPVAIAMRKAPTRVETVRVVDSPVAAETPVETVRVVEASVVVEEPAAVEFVRVVE